MDEFKPYELILPNELENLSNVDFERLYDKVEKFYGWCFGKDFIKEMNTVKKEMIRRKHLKSNKG